MANAGSDSAGISSGIGSFSVTTAVASSDAAQESYRLFLPGPPKTAL
jgi:hypothetical protein